jgi:hypothetical protein
MRGAQNKPEQEEFVQHLAQWQNVVTMWVVPNMPRREEFVAGII